MRGRALRRLTHALGRVSVRTVHAAFRFLPIGNAGSSDDASCAASPRRHFKLLTSAFRRSAVYACAKSIGKDSVPVAALLPTSETGGFDPTMKRVDVDAALHFAAGLFDEIDVPIGIHDLSRVRLTLLMPEGATVQRAAGSEGDGFELCKPAEVLSLPSALLFITSLGVVEPKLLRSCIVEAGERGLKPKDAMPDWARQVLLETQLQSDCKPRRKTPAQRIGIAAARYSIERLTAARFAELSIAKT